MAGHAKGVLNALVGGWQIAGMGRLFSNYITLPANQFPTGTKIRFYGHKYPIQDCRGGTCVSGYLLWNGYIPAYQINSHDSKGKPNGIEGVPSDYQPAVQPLLPYPANYPSLSAATDPNYPYYGTNTVFIPLKDGTTQRLAYGGINPLINQYLLSSNLWNCDASLFKRFNLKEGVHLRFQIDFFNVSTWPGITPAPGPMGSLRPTPTPIPADPG